MTSREKTIAWLMTNRTSARLAFLLRVGTMGISSLMGFIWTPLFVQALGDAVYGTFLSFQGATRLAGLGDFGLAGAVTVRTGQMVGRGEMDRLRPFLESARTVLLLMAIVLGTVFCVLAPWLPGWLDFKQPAGAGSLTLLFVVGGVGIMVSLLVGYLNGLNLAYATVTWPILPALVLSQLALLGQWTIARMGLPLWLQAIAPFVSGCLHALVLWWMLKAAHPWLGQILPLRFDGAVWRNLVATSGWVYLYSIGNLVFTTTDRLLINAGFGPAAVPPYLFNYKLCETAIQLIASAAFVGQAKINLWIHSPDAALQDRARSAVRRLLLFESLFGTAAALGYLAINNQFINVWVGEEYQRPATLQWAFALTLAITMGGNAGIQIAALCGPGGLRNGGIAIGVAALLNFVLSFIAMKLGSINGIAYATVLAQSLVSLYLARYTSRHLRVPTGWWVVRAWVLPVASVALLAALHFQIGSNDWKAIGLLLLGAAALVVAQARIAGVTLDFIRHEWNILRQMTGRNPKP